jgi:succinate dehydrogenase / fumarate reductase membrane anchor subunit
MSVTTQSGQKQVQAEDARVLTTPSGRTITLWEWGLLYGTGALLVVLLLGHIWFTHYVVPASIGLRYQSVAERLRLLSIQLLDLGLLTFALAHGLVGLRRIVVDTEVLGRNSLRIMNGVLILLGLAGLIVGVQIFQAFT